MAKRRFKKLVHYVLSRVDEPKKLGATKLNKVLWFIDTFSYRLNGESVSGDGVYVKRQYGPVPAKILETLRALEEEKAIHIRETTYFGKPKREFLALTAPSSDAFTEEERNLIDEVLEIICDSHTAASISDLSHDIIWDAAEMGEKIPLHAVLAARSAPPTKEDKKWASEVIKECRERMAA